jgi:subtilase family serine protease
VRHGHIYLRKIEELMQIFGLLFVELSAPNLNEAKTQTSQPMSPMEVHWINKDLINKYFGAYWINEHSHSILFQSASLAIFCRFIFILVSKNNTA